MLSDSHEEPFPKKCGILLIQILRCARKMCPLDAVKCIRVKCFLSSAASSIHHAHQCPVAQGFNFASSQTARNLPVSSLVEKFETHQSDHAAFLHCQFQSLKISTGTCLKASFLPFRNAFSMLHNCTCYALAALASSTTHLPHPKHLQ